MVCGAVQRLWAAAGEWGRVTASRPARFRFAHLGEGACLAFPPGAIFGERCITIDDDTLVGVGVSISAGFVPGQELGPDPIVEIGRRCSIGRGAHIVGHRSVRIGDDVFIAPYSYITDQNHTFDDPSTPIGVQRPVNNPVTIGDGCWLGAGAIVLPGTRLGRNVVVAGGAVVRGTFPDHCVVAGVPARIVRRYRPGHGWQPMPTEREETP
ncbi:acyltransferase [Streptomyces kanamyceticus]|uniref:Acyltransferase n=2 Tax=Streptomyces kanamyceticus TaxID=1967 RepID=A0A5J6GNZ5_STRKN|nr:acyltransferase [Streptomyces kanamyceticus]